MRSLDVTREGGDPGGGGSVPEGYSPAPPAPAPGVAPGTPGTAPPTPESQVSNSDTLSQLLGLLGGGGSTPTEGNPVVLGGPVISPAVVAVLAVAALLGFWLYQRYKHRGA